MTISAFDKDNIQYAWDATSLSAFLKCPRYYKYTILDSWEPRNKSVHLLFGGWYATALEKYHKHCADGMSHDDAQRAVVKDALCATWGKEFLTAEGKPGPWVSTDTKKTRETLIRTIIWYLEEYEKDPMPSHVFEDGTAAVEVSFRFEMADGFMWCGHFDQIANNQGHQWVRDQKTTGQTISTYYFNQFKPGTQMTGYAFGSYFGLNVPVKGVIVDAVQIAVGFSRFSRGFIMYDKDYLEEWYKETLDWLTIAREFSKTKTFPANPESCDKYGGCDFRDVCSKSPAVRDKFLRADFVKRKTRWDPLVPR